jgi:glucoamylase
MCTWNFSCAVYGRSMRSLSIMEPDDLRAWIARQVHCSLVAMERAASATQLTRRRDEFGQVIVPAKGSVLASPAIGNRNSEPDYFFHWLRDSAIVMRTVAELLDDAATTQERARWGGHFEEFIRFSLGLSQLDGAVFAVRCDYRHATRPEFRKFLRPVSEIRALTGDRLLGEPRFNPDGSIDILRWSRPQYDGPALRALACLRYLAAGGTLTDELTALLRLDLDFTARHASEPCIGPWEEGDEHAEHYYTALVQLGALVHGRAFLDPEKGAAAEQKLRAGLDQHWSERHQVYMAMRPARADNPDDLVDAAILLAVLDADLPEGAHSVADPRVHQTQNVIEHLFAREFPINHDHEAPALGRSRGDRYFGGGAWYPTTLAAAGLCYRRAQRAGQVRAALIARGDAFMATVRDMTPADGALSEQVDRITGQQTSARHLTWSYAAFISTTRLRAQALAAS